MQDKNESSHTLNTAQIALLSLNECRILCDSDEHSFNAFLSELSAEGTYLVYPSSDAIDVSELEVAESRQLIFLDGTWRKTRKLFYDYPQLQQLRKVSFRPTEPSRYLIRKAEKCDQVSTVEAIYYVLSSLERDSEKYRSLLTTMEYMIASQVKSMGEEVFRRNYQKI